jgi:hypothetical protein
MQANTRSHDRPAPREVDIDTIYGRLTYLEQIARVPSGGTKLVRWRGALDGTPIDRERIDALVLAHAIETLDLAG